MIGLESKGSTGELLEGALRCPQCELEFPVLDGIPVLVPDPGRYLAENVFDLVARDDLTPAVQAMIGEACGPGSAVDINRNHTSSYVEGHYGDFDPANESSDSDAGRIAGILEQAMALAKSDAPAGHAIDVGCAVGRSTFELANRCPESLALGIDKNFSMLRIAGRVRDTGTVRYARREVGLLYETREFSVEPVARSHDRVDFWGADAATLPLAPNTVARACALNVLDATFSPLDLLREFARVLMADGIALLATPWDWSGAVTEAEAWIGGHSPRGHAGGDSAAVLRALLSGGHPAAVSGLRLEAEVDRAPWRVRVHARSTVEYAVQIVLARCTD